MAGGRLQWNSVYAPNFGGVTDALRLQNQTFNNATDGLSKAMAGFEGDQRQLADQALYREMAKFRTPEEAQAAMASGQAFGGVDPRLVSAQALQNFNTNIGTLQGRTIKDYEFNQTMTADQRKAESARLALDVATPGSTNLQRQAGLSRSASDPQTLLAAMSQLEGVNKIGFLAPSPEPIMPPTTAALAGITSSSGSAPAIPAAPAPGSAVGTVLANAAGGAPAPRTGAEAVKMSIFGQESGFGKADTSKVNSQGVTGPMQVQRATFDGLKRNGVIPKDWDFSNPEHTKEAGFRHIDDLYTKYNGDPAKVAAAYYGGEKAVRSDGTINREMKNLQRPTDPTVGQYVDQVLGRINNGDTPASAPTAGTQAPAIRPVESASQATELLTMLSDSVKAASGSRNANQVEGQTWVKAMSEPGVTSYEAVQKLVADKKIDAGVAGWAERAINDIMNIKTADGRKLTAAAAAQVLTKSMENAPNGVVTQALDRLGNVFGLTTDTSPTNQKVDMSRAEAEVRRLEQGGGLAGKTNDDFSQRALTQLGAYQQYVTSAETALAQAVQRANADPANAEAHLARPRQEYQQALAYFNKLATQVQSSENASRLSFMGQGKAAPPPAAAKPAATPAQTSAAPTSRAGKAWNDIVTRIRQGGPSAEETAAARTAQQQKTDDAANAAANLAEARDLQKELTTRFQQATTNADRAFLKNEIKNLDKVIMSGGRL